MSEVATGPGWELRCGPWEVALEDVSKCDALISDPPYSERTHSGHDRARRSDASEHRGIDFAPWTEGEVRAFVDHWGRVATSWFVAMCDHVQVPWYEEALAAVRRLTFAPLQFVAPGSRARLRGDGPSCWTVPIVVARPMGQLSDWGTLPGAYILPHGYLERSGAVVGSKPLWLMQALVRDYTRPGDLVVDPCAGSGTTLLAAAIEGRRALGAELNERTFQIAVERLSKGYTPALRMSQISQDDAGDRQVEMFEEARDEGGHGRRAAGREV